MSGRGEKNAGWYALSFIVIPTLRSIAKFRMEGLDNIPKRGAFIAAPNHMTDLDPLFLAYILWHGDRVPRFLAKASLFTVPVVGWVLRRTGQVPVSRGGLGAGSLAAARQILENGNGVIVYPEGTLTRDPDLWPMRGKKGAVLLALEYDIPLVPIAHWGVQRILPRWSKKPSLVPRKQVDVLVGPPVDLSRWKGRARDSAALTEATEHVMNAITALLEEIRHEEAPAERWDPTAHGQSEFGRPGDESR